MTIALFLQAIQALTGSQFVKDKLQRSEYVIRVLKVVGIDPEHPPEDFEAVYVYALVEYGYGKPDVCLEIFRAAEIRSEVVTFVDRFLEAIVFFGFHIWDLCHC